jgi:hypothetical protein
VLVAPPQKAPRLSCRGSPHFVNTHPCLRPGASSRIGAFRHTLRAHPATGVPTRSAVLEPLGPRLSPNGNFETTRTHSPRRSRGNLRIRSGRAASACAIRVRLQSELRGGCVSLASPHASGAERWIEVTDWHGSCTSPRALLLSMNWIAPAAPMATARGRVSPCSRCTSGARSEEPECAPASLPFVRDGRVEATGRAP